MHNDACPTDVTTPPEKSKNSKQRKCKNLVFIQLISLVSNKKGNSFFETVDLKSFMPCFAMKRT